MRTLITMLMLLATLLFADVPRSLYVLNGSAETLSKMNMTDMSVTQNIAQSDQIPNDVVAHQGMIYVLNSGTSSLQVLDPHQDQVVKTIALQPGANPYDMAFVGTSKAYVSNWVGNTVSVVDIANATIVKELATNNGPEGILIVDNLAFICCTGYAGWGIPYGQGSVQIFDIRTDSLLHTLDVPTNPQLAALSPDGKIHVLCTGDYAENTGKIAVIDMYTGPMWNEPAVVDTLDLGGAPGSLVITPDGNAYVSAWGDGTNGFLYKYNAFSGEVSNNADHPILIGPNTGDLLYDGREKCLWIPYMSMWGGDGFVQKYDPATDSVVWTSNVLGNGSQKITMLETIWDVTPWADEVVSVSFGAGAGLGRNYFPQNILGAPDQDPMVGPYSPSNKPQEILSLGHGGEIVLGFKDNCIINGDGPDFTIFENCFISMLDNQPFVEAAIVSVSQDGETWHTFPYDTSDYSGMAGANPMLENFFFTDPLRSGGDQFDLETVGLESACYVKITDLGDLKSEGMFNGDFDLDAIVAINSSQMTRVADQQTRPESFELLSNYPNPFNPQTHIQFQMLKSEHVRLTIYDALGREIVELENGVRTAGEHTLIFNATDFPTGMYIAHLQTKSYTSTLKMMCVK